MTTVKRVRGGKWEVLIEAGRHPNGRRHQLRRRYPDRRAALEGAARLALEAAEASEAACAGPTLSTHCESWLTGRRGNLAPKTFESYACSFRRYVTADAIGTIPLSDLSPTALRAWLRRIADYPGIKGGSLSQQTLLHHYRYLGAALNAAVAWGLLTANPLQQVDAPKVGHDRQNLRVWTAEQVRHFLAELDDSPAINAGIWRAVWGFVLVTGLRRGELAGLMWRDIDFDAGTLTVVRTRLAGQSETSPTKSACSNRTLPLSDAAVEYLHELRKTSDTHREHHGAAWAVPEFVLVLPDGRPPKPDTITQRVRRDCQTAGVPYIGIQGLRHTFATLALDKGVSAHVVADILGHHDVAFTLRTYGHLLPRAHSEAMNAVGNLIFGPSATENVTSDVT